MRASPFQIVTALATFLAGAMTLTILVSLFEVSIGRIVASAILVASLAGAIAIARRLPAMSEGPRPVGRVFQLAGVVAISIASCLWLMLLVPALLKPDITWDGNSYHVPAIHHWALRGYVHWIGQDAEPAFHWPSYVDNLLNGYPKGFEVICFLLVRACGSSHPVNAVNLLFVPLGAFSIASMATRLGTSWPSAAIAGAAYMLVPVNVAQANTTYVDAALAASVATLAAAALEAVADILANRSAMRAAPAFGAGIGLALSIKASGLSVGLLPLVMIGGLIVVRGRDALRRHLPFVLSVGAIACVVGSYFYLRNAWHKGNPVYPVQVAFHGRVLLPGTPLREQITETGVTPPFMAQFPAWKKIATTWSQAYTLHMWPESIKFFDAREGGLGFSWLLAGVPAALGLAVKRTWDALRPGSERAPAILFLFLFVHIAISFVLAPLNWWARYTAWLHVLGLPAAAVVLDGIRMPRWRIPTALWAGAWAWIALVEGFYCWGWATGPEVFVGAYSPPTSVAQFMRQLSAYNQPNYMFPLGMPQWMKEVVASRNGFAFGPATIEAGPLQGLLSMPIGARPLAYLTKDAIADEGALRTFVREHRVRFVVWDETIAPVAPAVEALARRKEAYSEPRYLWTLYDVGAIDEPLSPLRAK
jgi:hypothetical protein